MGFRIRNTSTQTIEPGIPTPFLIEQGGGEAYFVAAPETRSGGVWYAKAPGYESPDGKYTRVRVEHTEDFRVDVHIRVDDPSADASDPDVADAMEWDDYFIVEAATEQEAQSLAREKAGEEVERQWGEAYGYETTIQRTRRGVSI